MVSELQSVDPYFPILIIWVDIQVCGVGSIFFPVFTHTVIWARKREREGRGKEEGRQAGRKEFLCCQSRPEELHSPFLSYQFLSKVDWAGNFLWSLHVSDILSMCFLWSALLTVQEILRCNLFSSYHQFYSAEENTLCQFYLVMAAGIYTFFFFF